jgi:hypothetical protein
LDDRRWEAMSFVDVFRLDMLPQSDLICQYPNARLSRCAQVSRVGSGGSG